MVEQSAVELRRVVRLEPERLIGDQCERGCVAFAKAIGGETLELSEDLLGNYGLDTVGLRARLRNAPQRSHGLGRPAAAHRPAQQIGLARCEAGQRHRDTQDLFLEDDHAKGLGQRRLRLGCR